MIEADDSEQTAAPGGVELDLASLFARFERTLLGGPRKYNRSQISQAAGIEPQEARKLWRALGFASVEDDEVVFTDGDVTALEQTRFLAEHAVIDDDLRTAMTRMLGQTFSRLAAWQGQLLIELVTGRPELLGSEEDIAQFARGCCPSSRTSRRSCGAVSSSPTSRGSCPIRVRQGPASTPQSSASPTCRASRH